MKNTTFRNVFLCAYTLALAGSAFLLAQGCGGAPEDASPDELGTVQEPINIGNDALGSGTHGYGVLSGGFHGECTYPGPVGQDCYIPALKPHTAIVYCFDGGFSAQEVSDYSSGFTNVDNSLAYTFTRTTLFPCAGINLLSSQPQTGGGTVIDSYMAYQFTGTNTTLTSGPGITHVNGTWHSVDLGLVHVDTAKVNALGLGLAPPLRAFIGAHSAALYMGQGTQTAFPNSPSRRAVNPTNPVPIFGLTSGEVCRINNYIGPPGAPGNTVNVLFNCGD